MATATAHIIAKMRECSLLWLNFTRVENEIIEKNGCTRRQLQISNDNSVRVILQLHYELEFCMRPKQHHLEEIASVEF